MKNIKIIRFLAFISLVFLVSCSGDDEPVDPQLLLNNSGTPTCEAPVTLTASGFINNTSINLTWETGSGGPWQVQYGVHGFTVAAGAGTSVVVTTPGTTINGLVSTTSYDFYIRTICGNNQFSAWVGPVSPGSSTVACALPTNFSAIRSTTDPTQVTTTWSANGDESSWQVQYGVAGFAINTGIIVTSNTTSKVITGLDPTISYDFYVRSNCSATDSSYWVGPINVNANGVVSNGDYWPRAVQNQWVFAVNNVNQQPLKILSTDIVNGNTYYSFQETPAPAAGVIRLRKTPSGDYYYKIEDVTITAGSLTGVTSGYESIILKDYLPVGSTWTDSFAQTTTYVGMPGITLDNTIVSSIEEKGITVNVSGVNYTNVIVVKRILTASGVGYPTTTVTSTYWFAKDVGPIKITTDNSGTVTTQLLTAHQLY